jgi:hypothetical protein
MDRCLIEWQSLSHVLLPVLQQYAALVAHLTDTHKAMFVYSGSEINKNTIGSFIKYQAVGTIRAISVNAF